MIFSRDVISALPRTQLALDGTVTYDVDPFKDFSFYPFTDGMVNADWWTGGVVDPQRWIISATLDLYCYASGAVPTEGDFKARGGMVFVIGAYNGLLYRDPDTPRAFGFGDRKDGDSGKMYWFIDYVETNVENTGRKLLQS